MAAINKPQINVICPICQNTDAFLAIGSTDKAVPLVSCPKCNAVFIEHQSMKSSVDLSSPTGEKVKEVFGKLDKLRGYRPPKRKAEAASIIRMLKRYTPNQIIATWESLKQDKFWQNQELFMMSVESQIGAIIHKKGENEATDGIIKSQGVRIER